jgi:dipeptidyl aminopeptidase/acylaminoacyl peptidase
MHGSAPDGPLRYHPPVTSAKSTSLHRRPSLLAFLLLGAAAALPGLGAPPPPVVSGLSFSPDGAKVLVSTDADGVPNAWALPVAGGAPVQLTRSPKDPVWSLCYFPRDERILYRSGPAGDEDHLFVRELDGKAVELFPGKTDHFIGWMADGALLVEADNLSARSHDLYRIAADGYGKTLVNRNSSDLSRLVAASPDGRYLAYKEDSNDLIRTVRVHDLKTDDDQSLLLKDGFTIHVPLRFRPDSGALLALSDVDQDFNTQEFRGLVSWDLMAAVPRDLIRRSWDVRDALYSSDGKRLAVIAGGDTRTDLELYDAATLKPVALPPIPGAGDVAEVAFSRDGRELAALASGGAMPPAVWVYDLSASSAPRRLGDGAGAGIEGTLTRFQAPDKTSIPGILYKPAQASPEHKVAAIVWIHDGPSGQSRLGFDPIVQSLVQHGYAVLAVNERGSFGYGWRFQSLDDRRHGKQDLDDCVAAKAVLAATGWVDPARIALGGTGFGGYLTLAALTSRPQEFAAGVDLFGIGNWQRVLDALPFKSAERGILADEMGHAGGLETLLWAPYRHAADIARPLILVQGARDTLAIPAEAAEIVAAVKAKRGTVEEIVLPDAAHGLILRGDREKVYDAVAGFLDRNLKAAAAK